MEKKITVSISNNKGNKELINGEYNVTASVKGYNGSSVKPNPLNITSDVATYNLTIEGAAALTFHVTDTGYASGFPISGATFYRCDSRGKTYGDPVVTDNEGYATLSGLPLSGYGNTFIIYFKQTTSDATHSFTTSIQQTVLDVAKATLQIKNEFKTS